MSSNALYVLAQIRAASAVRILTHSRSDGDALGSAFALARICAHVGTPARVTLSEPPPERLSFLCDPTLFSDSPYDGELVISVDVASPEQLGTLRDAWCRRVNLKIDHHAISPAFGDWQWIDPIASAAGELIFAIAEAAGCTDPVTATLIYIAITSDTGSFRYSNTTPRTFGIACTLAQWGADVSGSAEKLFENISLREAKARAVVYSRMKLAFDGRVCTVLITNDDRTASGTLDEDYGNASSLLRSIEEVQLAVAIKQNDADPKTYKISTRSTDPVDCAALCAKVGGGGHVRAAGATLTADSPTQAEEQVLALCAEVFA